MTEQSKISLTLSDILLEVQMDKSWSLSILKDKKPLCQLYGSNVKELQLVLSKLYHFTHIHTSTHG